MAVDWAREAVGADKVGVMWCCSAAHTWSHVAEHMTHATFTYNTLHAWQLLHGPLRACTCQGTMAWARSPERAMHGSYKGLS